jgi:hypothetical protein
MFRLESENAVLVESRAYFSFLARCSPVLELQFYTRLFFLVLFAIARGKQFLGSPDNGLKGLFEPFEQKFFSFSARPAFLLLPFHVPRLLLEI